MDYGVSCCEKYTCKSLVIFFHSHFFLLNFLRDFPPQHPPIPSSSSPFPVSSRKALLYFGICGLEGSQVPLISGLGTVCSWTHLRVIINTLECWQNIQTCRHNHDVISERRAGAGPRELRQAAPLLALCSDSREMDRRERERESGGRGRVKARQREGEREKVNEREESS